MTIRRTTLSDGRTALRRCHARERYVAEGAPIMARPRPARAGGLRLRVRRRAATAGRAAPLPSPHRQARRHHRRARGAAEPADEHRRGPHARARVAARAGARALRRPHGPAHGARARGRRPHPRRLPEARVVLRPRHPGRRAARLPPDRATRAHAPLLLPGGPYGIALDQRRRLLWVTLPGRNELVELPAHGRPHVLRRRPTVRQPDAVAVDEPADRVIVTRRLRLAARATPHHAPTRRTGRGDREPPRQVVRAAAGRC